MPASLVRAVGVLSGSSPHRGEAGLLPAGTNALQLIFRQRFSAFAELYQDR
jgi:hypothetical protein